MATKIQLDLAINNAEAVQSIGQAKTALKELKSALAFGVDEKDTESIKKAEEAYRKLKDKVDDVNDSLKANADEGLTQVGNQFKYVKDRIFELDFTKANQGLKNLGASVKGISFGQIKEGIKTFGSSLGELGNVMKTALGPWGLLILAVVTVIGFLYSLKDTIKPVGQLFAWFGSIVESVVKFFTDLTDAMGLTTVARDKENESIRNSAELNENAIKGSYGRQIELLEKLHKNSTETRLQMTRELVTQYDKERKAASDAFNDIAAKEKGKQQKTKEYYEALTKFQEINQKRSQEIQNINTIKLGEKERLEKNAFDVSVEMDKARTDAKLVSIKNETIRAKTAENEAYTAAIKAKKEAQKTDGKTEEEHNKEIVALTISHNTKLIEINNSYREKEKQARIDQKKTELGLTQLYEKETVDFIYTIEEKRLNILEDEKNKKLTTLIKGSEQYKAVLAQYELDRLSIEKDTNDKIKNLRDKNFNSTIGNLNAQIAEIGGKNNELTAILMQTIASQTYFKGVKDLDDQLAKGIITKLEYAKQLGTLKSNLATATENVNQFQTGDSLSNKQSKINKDIAEAELGAIRAKNDLKFNEEQKYLDKLNKAKKDQIELDRDQAVAAAKGNQDMIDTATANYTKAMDAYNLAQESASTKTLKKVQNVVDTIQKGVEDVTNGIFDLLDAFEDQSESKGNKLTEAEEKRAKARFEIHKAFSLAAAVVQGAINVQGAWEGIAKAGTNPVKIALAVANLAATVGTNALTISKIAQTQYKSASASSSGSASGPSVQSPSINLYGSGSQTNNLTAQNANQRADQQMRVYVVENDISQAQTNVGRYKTSVSLG